jgi:hypothetical protein
MKQHRPHAGKFAALCGALALCGSFALFAQEGFPLNGSWSGERQVDGRNSRVLVVMELQRDQSVSGFVIENGKRQLLRNVKLNPQDWTVSFALEDGSEVQGQIHDLGSNTERKIHGKWAQGDFSLDLN